MIRTVDINGETFSIDMRYYFISELISDAYQNEADTMNMLFGSADDVVMQMVNTIIEKGCDDIAMNFFMMMVLQNYGETAKAAKLIEPVYRQHPDDLLARSAYINALIFTKKVAKIPEVLGHVYDIEKATTQREIPLVTFVHYVSNIYEYCFMTKDAANAAKQLQVLLKAAPEHEITQKIAEEFVDNFKPRSHSSKMLH